MRKIVYLLAFIVISSVAAKANVGDTTWVQANHVNLNYYNNFDTSIVFPDGTVSYRKIYMIMTLGEYTCPSGTQYCHQWDYDLENYIMTPGGDTLELSRFVTPYATSGTPGFSAAWKQHYIFDVTDYYTVLKDSGTVRIHYSGYSGGFTLDVKFAFIQGTPERNVLGITRLWSGGYTFGNPSNLIDSNIQPLLETAAPGMESAEMKVAITGHGADNTSECCEFDATSVGHAYAVVANGNTIAQTNMNVNCGASELYPQGGTWAYARAGNWCPGGSVTVAQYKLPGVTAGNPYTADLNFDDNYDGGGNYGDYKIEASMFYYGGYNHTLDASLEDIVAPTNFEWYHRENPRVSVPVVKVRNTGSTPITSIAFRYGVKDSAMSQYTWTGTIAPLTDTLISLPALPALTNLSLISATGLYHFVAEIQQVNGTADNDQSNDTLTSSFAIAPTWPSTFVINMLTSSLGADGNFGSNPSDASWKITDQDNIVVASRTNNNVQTTYHDTVNLNPSGFYTLTVSTTQCVGLHWWPLDGQSGYSAGSLVVRDFYNNVNLPVSGSVYAGTYHDDFGCGFVQYFTTSEICLTAPPTITQSGDTLLSSPASSYQWYRNDSAIAGATKSYYINYHHLNGNYSVVITDENSCTGNSSEYLMSYTGINELVDLSSIAISPNPAKDIFNISASSQLIGETYTLSDVTGRIVASGAISGLTTPVSISSLSSGVFFLHINGQNKQSFKVVKD
jgi:hypothetical protein